ncbi:MAG: hypothetical protein QM368_09825 [Bacillota bacterium]|jgi:hypothetical protein|nr:hypothetical protein [Bacillota bacterium]HHU29099.1 hypothetical protein [Bacillota bacterium]
MDKDTYLFDEPGLSEAELVFLSTTSKKHLSGVRGRASRTGRVGSVRTPVDFLSGKEKREYMKSSEVKVYNMYEDKVLPYEEFKQLPIEKQVVLMTKWRDEIGTNNIIRDMKISRKKFYSEVLKSLGIETKPRGRRSKKEEEKNAEAEKKAETAGQHTESGAVSAESVKSSFSVVFSGILEGHAAAGRLARLARILDDNSRYCIKVELSETKTV